jgi:DNA-binding beta-propeller fold protein YncE
MRARLVVGLVLAAALQACQSGGASSTPDDGLPPDTLDHDAAHRFVGSWFGRMKLTVGDTQAAQVPVVLVIAADGRNSVTIPGLCGGNEVAVGRVTSDTALVLGKLSCPMPEDDCTLRWSIQGGAGLRATGPVLTLALEGPASGCGLSGENMRFDFTSERPGFAYRPLPHQVLDARYDAALDRIVMIDAVTRTLLLYDATSGVETSVPLPYEPTCLALSPDGGRALVGHAGWFTTVELAEGRVLETRPTDTTAGACALASDWAYLFPSESYPVPRGVQLATYVEPRTPYPGEASSGVLSPDGASLYGVDTTTAPPQLNRWDIRRGPLTFAWSMPWEASTEVGPRVWLDPVGARIFTSAGTAYGISSSRDQDLQDAGRLEGFEDPWRAGGVRHLDPGASGLAAIPAAAGPSTAAPGAGAGSLDDSRVELYDPATLAHRGSVLLPFWLTAGDPLTVHGRYVFHGKDGVLHVIAQADASAGLPRGWTILRLQGDEPAPEAGDHGAPLASIALTGAASPGVALPLDGSSSADPDGRGLSYQWTVLEQPQGATAAFSAPAGTSPHFTASKEGAYLVQLAVTASDGERGLASARVIVTDGALPGLDHGVTEARYSRALDRVVMIDGGVAALFVYDPRSRQEVRVSLGATPSCLSVSPDGLSALVGHPGSLSVVDLANGAVVTTHVTTTDPSDCVLAGNGWAYLFPWADQWVEVHGVELATGREALSAQWSIWAGARAQLAEDGTAMYSVDRGLSPVILQRWDISRGPPAQAWEYRSTLGAGATQLWAAGLRVYAGDASWLAVGGSLEDVVPGGTLSGVLAVQALDATTAEVAVVPTRTPPSGADLTDTTVELLEPALLGHMGRLALPAWTLGGNSYPTHGRFVFHGPGGQLYVVAERTDGPPGQWFALLTF